MSIGPQHNGGILGATNNPTSTSAGGIWTPVQHYQAQRDGLWPVATAPLPDYTISRSLRFNKTDSAALNYTPAIAGNRKTWILSTWVKSPGTFMTNDNPIFAVRPGATPYTLVTLRASNAGTAPSALLIEDNASGMVLSTAMVFRDYSAWYHIVVAVDTTQSVSTNRVKMFVNGVQVTTFAGYTTYPNQNIDTQINSTNTHYIGRDPYDTNNWYSGYLADFRFIDGYPSGIDGTSWNNAGSIINLFGETDLTTGVWKPKAYSGSYGTNGFYLPFTDNSTQNNLGVNTAQVGDELRNYTVLHLSGNPANTSGYNCFSDRSSNNHLLTASGDIPTSARSPFTDTTSGSAYFNGSSYLTIPHNSILNFDTGTFTVEAWVYPTVGNTYHTITGKWANLNQDNWLVTINNNALLFFYNGGSLSGGTISTNVWTHVAVSRNSSNLITLYVNGIAVATTTNAFNSGYTYQLEIGSYAGGSNKFNGYISNLRIIKGQALFTGNFTPSTSPLTSTAVGHTGTGAASSITGTVSLLTLVDKVGANNSGFIDESTNNAVITRSGNVTQGSFSPFGTSGWSYYYNGSSWTSNPSSSAFAIGTKLYTIEFWAYFTSTPNTAGGTNIFGVNAVGGWIFGANATNTYVSNYGIGTPVSAAYTLPTNTWLHIAIARGTSNSSSIWVNGTRIVNVTDSYNYAQGLWGIGGNPNSNAQYISAYISNGRVVLGYDLYGVNNTTISVPTSPLTAVAGTTYLTAQSNQFIDNSANSAPFTLNGTPQVQPLSPFQPHTSITNTYSTYFNGANSITATTNSLFALPGAFTVEFWLYPTSNSGEFISITSTGGLDIGYQNSTTFGIAAAGVAWRLTTTTLPTLNAWNHIVFSRGGTGTNQASLFINGTRVANGTLSDSFVQGTTIYLGSYGAGYYLTGYLSNLRIVKDQDLYGYNNTQISVPTSPLTRTSQGATASNVALLTLQSSTLVDNGINTITLFNNGAVEPRISEFNPLGRTFTTGVNYSATTHGSSGYFNGSSNNHLSTTAGTGSGFDFGTGEFTVEAWIYPYSVSSLQGIFGTHVGGNNWWQFRLNTTTLEMWGGDSTGTAYTGNTAIPANTWTHIAASRSGTSVYVSVNGSVVARSIGAASTFPANTNLTVGNLYSTPSNYWFNGHITGVRILKGTALYKSNFVPQLQPPQAVANTQLLLNFNNAGVVDYTGKNVLETAGTSKSITSTKKTITDATGSLYFDGTVGNVLQSASNQVLAPGTGDFTLEAWVYFNSAGVDPGIVQIGPSLPGTNTPGYTNSIGLARATTGGYNGNLYIIQSGATYVSSGILTIGTWHHTAVVRQSGVQKVYLNGVLVGSVNDTNNYTGTYLFAGCNYGTNYPINGYIQDIRYTKVARYTGTFTPPVRTFSATVRDIGHKQWVVNNLSVASGAGNDSLVDSPSNYGVDTGLGGEVRGNYCTLNPLWLSSSAPTLTNGNLDTTAANSTWNNAQGTFGISSGKWYWESTMSGDMFFQLGVGLREAINNVYSGSDVNSWTYDGRAFKNGNGSQPAYGATFAGGDIISVALDMDAGTLTFYKNGVSQGVAFSSGLAGKTVFPQFGCYQAGRSQSVNFGQRPFAYTAPSGYKALCTQNLPAPSIVKSNTAFDTLAYAGNDSQTISGLNFSPDLVWVKSRSNATYNHQVHDSVRGPTAGMLSTNLIATENSTYQFTSFNNNGFTTASGNVAGINNSGNTFVAWAWDAGTSTVTNTTGTITSQVRANPTAGISIVGYTGNSTNNATIGHGLTSIPNFIILKNRDQAYYWRIYHSYYYNGGSPTQGLLMGPADGTGNRSSYTHDAAGGINLVNSTRFGVTGTTYEGVNYTGNRYIAYCFSDISGYSSFGSYVGNGSTNGPFVYLGFKPAWIMVKVVYTATGNNNYWIYDAARNPSNLVTTRLSPNETAVESYGGSGFEFADFVSNGIKFRGDNWGWNQNGTSYIYAAFAENPFKYSLAR